MHVCTRERARERKEAERSGKPGHAAGQGSTFASRVHIIPGMFAKSTCRRKMSAGGTARGMHFVAHWYSRALLPLVVYLVFLERETEGERKKIREDASTRSVQNAICEKRASLVVKFLR